MKIVPYEQDRFVKAGRAQVNWPELQSVINALEKGNVAMAEVTPAEIEAKFGKKATPSALGACLRNKATTYAKKAGKEVGVIYDKDEKLYFLYRRD